MPPQEKIPEVPNKDSKQIENPQFEMVPPKNGYTNNAFVSDPHDKNQKVLPQRERRGGAFEFDDLLPYIGEFGIYQKILFLLMIPFAFFVAWVYFTQIFITLVPENHWCWVPELANLTEGDRIALAIPPGDSCNMYDVNYQQLLNEGIRKPDPNWPITACKHGWEYDFSETKYPTIATEQNWVCQNKAFPPTAQSIFFCGAILGGLIFGWIADKMGRIPALVGTNLVGLLGGIATAFCNSFWTFCVCRFLVGMAFDNCFTMMYILVLEYVGPKWRTFVANMSIAIFFTFAACILPWIAVWLSDWRMLCFVTSTPLALAIITPWVVPESARWLVSQGKVDQAIKVLKKFEKVNRTHVGDDIYNKFRDSCLKAQEAEESERSYTVLDLFKTPHLRRITVVLIVLWMAISLVFDGHVRNVGTLGLDVFLTFTIASATEFPADTFLTFVLDLWGRRWLACGSMVLSGIFSLLATAVPYGIPSASLAIVGRFAVNISYNIGLQYAAELLPTVVRAQGVALIHIMGFVASILSPIVVFLAEISVSLPLWILGILGIVGGVLALFLPETLDQELPQTLQDGENFGKDQKIFDFPCINKRPAPLGFERRGTLTRGSSRGEIRSSMINRGSIRSKINLAA